jgi:hypothetical protein
MTVPMAFIVFEMTRDDPSGVSYAINDPISLTSKALRACRFSSIAECGVRQHSVSSDASTESSPNDLSMSA